MNMNYLSICSDRVWLNSIFIRILYRQLKFKLASDRNRYYRMPFFILITKYLAILAGAVIILPFTHFVDEIFHQTFLEASVSSQSHVRLTAE